MYHARWAPRPSREVTDDILKAVELLIDGGVFTIPSTAVDGITEDNLVKIWHIVAEKISELRKAFRAECRATCLNPKLLLTDIFEKYQAKLHALGVTLCKDQQTLLDQQLNLALAGTGCVKWLPRLKILPSNCSRFDWLRPYQQLAENEYEAERNAAAYEEQLRAKIGKVLGSVAENSIVKKHSQKVSADDYAAQALAAQAHGTQRRGTRGRGTRTKRGRGPHPYMAAKREANQKARELYDPKSARGKYPQDDFP